MQPVLALGLVVSPVMGSHAGAAEISWVAGAVAPIVTAAAIKPSTEDHHPTCISL
ncbi:hypothetical protein ABLI39_16610 [Pseudarthrobacter sp. B907]|uniref:hypothetical protein n=1 Tax=Pseudarthrobacter sp. B907 TaxID=3158261 RepID=UPI0032DA70DC